MSHAASRLDRGLRRHPRVACHSPETGVWALYHLDTGRLLFVDELSYRLLEICESFPDRESLAQACGALASGTPLGGAPCGGNGGDLGPLDVAGRLAELEDFGAFTLPAPPPKGPEVLLVDPPCPPKMMGSKGPAKGLGYLSVALEAAGLAPARILDLRSVSDRLGGSRVAQAAYFTRWTTELDPRVIGITAVSATIEPALFIAELAKTVFPRARVVMGGPHVAFEWRETLARRGAGGDPVVDLIVRGEGEIPFPRVVERWVEDPATRQWDDIEGLAWRDADGEPVTSGWCHGLEDLDLLPFPDERRGLLNAEDYELQHPRIISSRGCPFSCVFCSTATFAGRRLRRRSVANVIEEMCFHQERYGTRTFTFDDDIFTVDPRRTRALCAAIGESPLAGRIEWGCNTRIDGIDEDLMDVMYDAGCRWIFFGVETGNEDVQRRFAKGRHGLEGFRRKMEHLLRLGIDAQLNFILGLPGETPESARRIFDLVQGLPRLGCSFTFLNVFPGTPLAAQAADLGLQFVGQGAAERYSLTAPTLSTPSLSEAEQLAALLDIQWRRQQERADSKSVPPFSEAAFS